MKKLFLILSFLFYINSAFSEFLYLGRSQEGLLMGDAYTAVADDENTLFYNPAALARHSGVSIYPVNPSFGLPNLLEVNLSLDNTSVKIDDRLSDFPKGPAAIADKILGFPLYLELGVSPTIKMANFGFTLFAKSKTSMVLENAYHPTLNLDYRLDRGFIFGYAFTFGKPIVNKSGKKSGSQTSIGIGIKNVNRQGLSGQFDLFGTELLEIISNSDSYKEIRKNLGFSKGSGWGLDLGAEQTFASGNSSFTLGVSLLDVGDTSYQKEEGTSKVPKQDMSLNFGSAYNFDIGIFKSTFAADFSNALDTGSSVVSKLKIGGRLQLANFQFLMGWNGGYSSLGIGIDLFIFKLMLGYYGIEVGSGFRDKEAKRAVISLNLLSIEIDL